MKSFLASLSAPFLWFQDKTNALDKKNPRLMLLVMCAVLGLFSYLTYSNGLEGGMVLDNAIVLQMDPRLQAPQNPDVTTEPVAYAERNIFRNPFEKDAKLDKMYADRSWKDLPFAERLFRRVAAPFLKEPYRAQVERMFTENYWWPSFPTDLYRPLTTFSYFLNYTVLGSKTDTFSYHIVNLALHWINACLALLICRALWPNRAALAFLAAAIFALHPVAVESVTNIVGRADLLSTLSIFLAGYIYIRLAALVDNPPEGRRARARATARWGLGMLAFVVVSCLGVLTKESAVMLAGFVALYDFFFRFFKLPTPANTRFKQGRFALVAAVDGALIFAAIFLVRWAVVFETSAALKLTWALLALLLVGAAVPAVIWMNVEGEGKRAKDVKITLFESLKRYLFLGWIWLLPCVFIVFYAKKVILANSPFYGQIFIDNPIVGAGCFDGLMTAVKVLGLYLGMLVYPNTLSCDYSFNQIPVFWDHTAQFWDNAQAWVSLAVIVLLLVWALRLVKKAPAFGFGVCWFFVMILPTSNVLFNIGSIMAERFLYLPLLGFAIVAALLVRALALALDRYWERDTGARAACAVVVPALVLALLGVRSYVRNFDWRNDVSLWRSAVETCPRSFKVHKGYAGALRIEAQPNFPAPTQAAELDAGESAFINAARLDANRPLLSKDAQLTPEESARVARWRNQYFKPDRVEPCEQEIFFMNQERARPRGKPYAQDAVLTDADKAVVDALRTAQARKSYAQDAVLTDADKAAIDAERARPRRVSYAEDPTLDDADKRVRALWNAVIAERGLDKALARVEEGIRVLDSGDLPDSKQDNTLFFDSGLYYNTKAKVLEERGDVQEALRYYQRAYEILWRGVRVDMHVNKASKEAMRARDIAEDAIIDVGNPKIRTQFVIAATKLGRLQEAYESVMQTRRMIPLESEPASMAGVVAKEMGRLEEARALFIEALILNGQNQQAWSGLMEIYSKMPEAQTALLKSADDKPMLNKDNVVSAGDLLRAFLNLESLLWDCKRYDEAKSVRATATKNYGVPAEVFPLRDPNKRTGGVARSGRGIGVEVEAQ